MSLKFSKTVETKDGNSVTVTRERDGSKTITVNDRKQIRMTEEEFRLLGKSVRMIGGLP